MNEKENAVLEAVLFKPSIIDELQITPELFSDGGARAILTAIEDVRTKGVCVDLISVSDSLRAAGHTELVVTLCTLTERSFTAANAGYYTEALREVRRRERTSVAFREGLEALEDKTRTASEIVDVAERALTTAVRGVPELDDAMIGTLLPGYLKGLESKAIELAAGKAVEVDTGFLTLDNFIGGIRPGEMIVAAGRPGTGKTVFGLSLASHIAIDLRKPSAVFSLEMRRDEVIDRLIASRSSRFNLGQLRTGRIGGDDYAALLEVGDRIISAPLAIFDGPHTLELLRSRIRREFSIHGLRFAVVDYLGLLDLREGKEARWEKVGEASRTLKLLALELGITILLVVQLGREAEGREPTIANLRDSGSIEQDADRIVLLHSPDENEEANFRRVVAIVGKNRHGPRGRVELTLDGPHVRFFEG